MKKEKTFRTKNMTKKELEKFYKIKLTKGEFVVIKSWATRDCSAGIDHIGDSVDYSSRYAPFRRYVRALSRFSDGTKRSKFNFNKSYEKNIENIYIDESSVLFLLQSSVRRITCQKFYTVFVHAFF